MLYKRYEIGYNLLYVNCFGGHAMNTDFSRILTLLRKEKGISQKLAAAELNISQALLSHYEKGIRECGLDFVIRAADFTVCPVITYWGDRRNVPGQHFR